MESHIVDLEALSKKHEEIGKRLHHVCEASFFPMDIIAWSVLERSLQLLKGFCLLMRNAGYVCAVPLLRIQLDSVLRFYGIVTMDDPHGAALSVIDGKALKNIKGIDGVKMTDAHLVERLSVKNPDIKTIYRAASSYVHLEKEHFVLFAARSKAICEEGKREICIGDDDSHISTENKVGLIHCFRVITEAVLNLIEHWCSDRGEYGDIGSLGQRFTDRL
jgi:hypothetical protein